MKEGRVNRIITGDEYPLFSCDHFNNQIKLYIKEKFRYKCNTLKFKEIMTSKNKDDFQKKNMSICTCHHK